MSLSNTLTTLMDSARKHFEVTNKLSLDNLINLFNPNPNLLTGSKDFSGNWNSKGHSYENGTYKGLNVRTTEEAWNGISQSYQAQKGKTYTFSLYAKANAPLTASFFIPPVNGKNCVSGSDGSRYITTSWERYSITFSMTDSETITPRMEPGTDNTSFSVCGFKLEEGSLATPLTEFGGGVTKRLLSSLVPRIGGACYAA